MSSVEKLRIHVDKLKSANVSTTEISVDFLYAVLQEISANTHQPGASVDTGVIVSGGKFQE